MDGIRFDELARLFATPVDRRGMLRRSLGAGAITLLAALLPSRGFTDTTAAPLEEAYASSSFGRARSIPRTSAPAVRPAKKGTLQITEAGTPAISLNPTSGKIKTTISATLTGFRGNEAITLAWYDGTKAKTLATGTTSAGGKATISFVAPYAFRGYHVVRATGSRGSKADAKFAIVPSLTLSPKSAIAGTTVKTSLSGFAATAIVEILIYPGTTMSGTPLVLKRITVSGSGTGTGEFTIRNSFTLGNHRIEAREKVSGRLASATLAVRCNADSECPDPAGQCTKGICSKGVCGTAHVPAGVICTENGGSMCSATGQCVECVSASNCPAPANAECSTATCMSGQCGIAHTPSGVATAQQTQGDCVTRVCDGQGGIGIITDANDLPTSLAQCETVTCTQFGPVISYQAPGTACSESGGTLCDGAGTCVECLSSTDCQQPSSPDCAYATCTNGTCGVSAVAAGTSCNDDGGTVCDGAGNCLVCTPNVIQSCYSGPSGTEGVGICKSGSQSCGSDGSGWGPCNGEVTPQAITCDGGDRNCDGLVEGPCGPIAHGTGGCNEFGLCVVTCEAGFASCDGQYETGCEADLYTDEQHCGACNHSCAAGEMCSNGICS